MALVKNSGQTRQTLATLYRPVAFNDVTEQSEVITILKNQLETNTVKHVYLFTGGAGTGKTTLGRIFAKEINHGHGNPIEIDAASHNSVDNIRELSQQAKTQSLDSEYKIFILDEVHALSNNAWQAMLKLIEEPPSKSIFIMCTTDPQRIPKTILSRCQRYDFKRISQQGIVHRLQYILANENIVVDQDNIDAVEFIAKMASGGMRDAITMLDKCLSYSTELTLENVVKVLGVVDYDKMFDITDAILDGNVKMVLDIINDVYMSGKDMKQFAKNYLDFILDVCKYGLAKSFSYIKIPNYYEQTLKGYSDVHINRCVQLLDTLVKLDSEIKWNTTPKELVESTLVLEAVK